MAKKDKFSQLGKGAGDLIEGLEILNRDSNVSSINPLRDTKKGKSKKQVAKPSRIKPKDVAEKLQEVKKEKTDQVKSEESTKSGDRIVEEKVEKKVKTRVGEGQNKIKRPQSFKAPLNVDAQPNDFRSHSMLISASQLDTLRQRVYLIKASGNRKYSIKDAVYEAFEMYLSKRKELTEFPDDFMTYTPSISMQQWERMNSAMYQVKASDNTKYAMKYAIFEAIEMYLQSNK